MGLVNIRNQAFLIEPPIGNDRLLNFLQEVEAELVKGQDVPVTVTVWDAIMVKYLTATTRQVRVSFQTNSIVINNKAFKTHTIKSVEIG